MLITPRINLVINLFEITFAFTTLESKGILFSLKSPVICYLMSANLEVVIFLSVILRHIVLGILQIEIHYFYRLFIKYI